MFLTAKVEELSRDSSWIRGNFGVGDGVFGDASSLSLARSLAGQRTRDKADVVKAEPEGNIR